MGTVENLQWAFINEVLDGEVLLGKNVSVTGTLSVSRNIIYSLVDIGGGKIHRAITASTHILIVPTNPKSSEYSSTKWCTATELGIDILTEEELCHLLVK